MSSDKEILQRFEASMARQGHSLIREVSPRQGYYVSDKFFTDKQIIEHYKKEIEKRK
jgi:hypothetical protein